MTVLLPRLADSTDVDSLPAGLPGYAGYVDGAYVTFPQLVRRFYPHAHCVSLTVTGERAAFIDCEKGDHSPAFCVQWLQQSLFASAVPANVGNRLWRHGIYFPMTLKPEIDAQIQRLMPDVPRERYRKWGAHWGNTIPTSLPADLDALQCVGGLHAAYDLSVVSPTFYDPYLSQQWPVMGEDDVFIVLEDDGI